MDQMPALNSICYKRNFLTEVIARLDFVSPVAGITAELPKTLSDGLLTHFPIAEPKKMFSQTIQVLPTPVTSPPKEEFTQWNFFGMRREKRVVLTPSFLFVSFRTYETYEKLREEFLAILKPFFQEFPVAQPSRMGLRYINNLELPQENPLKWDKYINRRLLSLFSFTIREAEPARVFHNLEVAYPDFNLRFQFGMHNPDYPAPIRQPVFVLDFDAYHKGLIAPPEVEGLLDKFHGAVQSLFEKSITAGLREVLNAD
jgi:uncharacterized protein (TIGR04255 family)